MKVVYGHTDSIYVQIDNVEKAQETIKVIESEVRKKFPNVLGLEQHPVVLEFEKYYSALGVGTTKNRNAGMITWDDGVWLDKPKFTMTGFTAKRVSETKLSKEVQTTVLTMWVNQKSFAEINKYCNDTYNAVLNGKIPIESVIKRSRLKEERLIVKCPDIIKNLRNGCNKRHNITDLEEKYCSKCGVSTKNFTTLDNKKPSISAGIAGVVTAYQKGNANFDDSYLYAKVKTNDVWVNPLTKEIKAVEYMSASTYEDFSEVDIDWKHYAETVLKKAEPVYKAMGWDLSSIRTGTIQSSLEEWF
jgi:DNA polymerase elongation subunit (family B)